MTMFSGCIPATIDDKGRLKVPAQFRQQLFKEYGPDVFMTVIRDMELLIYPLKIWEEKLQRLLAVPDSLPEKHRLLLTANFYGAEKTVDEQGRLPIPQMLRDKVGLDAEAAVIGYLNTLVVMNEKTAREWVDQNSPTPEVYDKLTQYGV